ncbi:MAG: MBL fold metallo-hydrolase [Eubacteriales bacterium]|nr:MBL fold metallo-hydrolase [Eubacteriales bacterium]
MKVQILSENRTNDPACLAEHGLSVYVEAGDRKILFDAGASDIYRKNAERMKVDLEKVDMVVISHGHYDHMGGVPSFCEGNKTAKVYIHEKAFEKTYGMENGILDKEPCSIQWSKQQYEKLNGRLILTKGVTWISDDIAVSGTIPIPDDYVPTETFFLKNEDGSLSADCMEHEQFLSIRLRDKNGKSRGIFVFSGCSHTGVIPCIQYAKSLFPGERIMGLLAGMHLYNSDAESRNHILGQIASEEMDYVLPVHCTGIFAICDLRGLMKERCIPAGAGDKFSF